MSAITAAVERRLGLKAIVRDNIGTWSARTGKAARRDRLASFAWFYMIPAIPAVALTFWQVEVRGIGQMLSGVAVFTGLLFGLLVLMFNTGITLRKDGSAITNAHGLGELIGDLRANTTYAAVVAMVLATVLMFTAASADDQGAAPWGFSPAIAYLFAHLGLMLMTILRRLRTAFNYITR